MCLDIRTGKRLTRHNDTLRQAIFQSTSWGGGKDEQVKKPSVMKSHYERELIDLHVLIRIYK